MLFHNQMQKYGIYFEILLTIHSDKAGIGCELWLWQFSGLIRTPENWIWTGFLGNFEEYEKFSI